MKLAIVEKKTFLAGLQCTLTSSCAIVTTDASTTGLGITLWQKQDDGNTKPISYGSRYLNDTEKKYQSMN